MPIVYLCPNGDNCDALQLEAARRRAGRSGARFSKLRKIFVRFFLSLS